MHPELKRLISKNFEWTKIKKLQLESSKLNLLRLREMGKQPEIAKKVRRLFNQEFNGRLKEISNETLAEWQAESTQEVFAAVAGALKAIELVKFASLATVNGKNIDVLNYQAESLSGESNPLIKFNDEEKCLLGHITKTLLDPSYKFSVTSVVEKSDKGFILQGDVLSLSSDDLKIIKDGKWVYTCYYTLTKTRLSQGQYEPVGAIILNTNDIKDAEHLHFAAIQQMVKKYI